MTTRPYSECLDLALALVGVPDANTQEVARVKQFINSRARKAYAASRYWPRFLTLGEERIVSEEGLLPYTEDGKGTIKQVFRIHASEPFKSRSACEYADFTATADGILISGYQASEYGGFGSMRVSGSIIPEIDGVYVYMGQSAPAADGTTTAPTYQREDITTLTLTPSPVSTLGGTFVGFRWYAGNYSSGNYWESDISADYTTPDLATGNFTAQGSADGELIIEAVATYSAWITYKAAFTTTYGDADGEEPDMPEEWWEYCAWGARADFLRNDGQNEQAMLAEAEAQGRLDEQLIILDEQSGSHVFTRVVNHGNTQYR